MSRRTAVTALLVTSLPHGLALPQIIPLVSALAPNVTPSPLPLIPAINASTVTVVGTIIQPAIESAVVPAIEDVTDIIEGAFPTGAHSILDPEANILPLILPGILPVETDLPPVDAPEVALPDDNFPVPDEVSDSDGGLIAEPFFPDLPDLPDGATVPISTFNAVVQPLITVIQTLLNALPGNSSPPLPGLLPHPLLPTGPPDIFIDPLLPTETSDDAAATATDAVDALSDLPVNPSPTNSIAADLPFAKRQAPTDVDTSSIIALIAPILEAISAFLAQISIVGSAVPDAASTVESAAADLPVDLPSIPIDAPVLPTPEITLPNLPLPPVTAPSVLPTDSLPIDDSAPALPESPAVLPPTLPDLFSAIPNEVLDVPVPDDVQGIDWSAFESPPIWNPPVSGLDDSAIPDNVLNVPVPDFDANGIPIESPIDAVSDVPVAVPTEIPAVGPVDIPTVVPAVVSAAVPAAVPAALPTSLDAFGDLPDGLLDWPFNDIPDTVAPDVGGELPDLDDFTIPPDVLNVPVPDEDAFGVPLDLPTDAVGALVDSIPSLAVPSELSALAVPTSLLDVPVPTDVPTVVATALPAAPSLGDSADVPIPDDILNVPWPELDENGIPIDAPVDPVDSLTTPLAALPTNLNWWDIPVPDDWVDPDDVLSILPALAEPTALPAPALPIEDFGAGFPIQALPDVPLVLPTVSDVAAAVPSDNLLPVEGPAALTEALTDVPTDALSGLPTSILDSVPAVTNLAVAAPALPAVAAPALPVIPAVAAPALPAVPTVALPFQVPSLRKRQLSNLLAQTKLPLGKLPVVAPAADPVNTVALGLLKPLLSLLGVLLAKPPIVGQIVPNLGATLPGVGALTSALPLPAVPGVPDVGGLVGGVVPALPLPDVASLVPSLPGVPDVGGLVGGVVPALPLPDVANLVPSLPLSGVANIVPAPVLGAVAPVLDTATGAIAPVAGAAGSLTGVLDGLTGTAGGLTGPLDGLTGTAGGLTGPLGGLTGTAGGLTGPLGGLTGTATGAIAPVAGAAGSLTGVLDGLTGTAGGLTGPLDGLTGTAGGLTGPLGGLTGTLGGLTETLPVGLPLARRAVEEIQQGPASDWESFLGELDESKQPELAGLIHDSAKAVNNHELDALTDTLKSDLDDLSDDTKAMLLEGFGATKFYKRSMRHAKRQQLAGVPGVQSIGPNLDDAQKIDVSGFNLDPNNQLTGLAAGGTPVDSDHPPPRSASQQLAGSSLGLSDPELIEILASGGLDPNGMLDSAVAGVPVDDLEETDPYEGVRQPLEGLGATLQAAKDNRFSGKKPNLSWVSTASGSAAANQAEAAAKQQAATAANQQDNVLQWFQRFVTPSWNKHVDAEIAR